MEAGLQNAGRAMLALATNLDPERVPGLILALPEPLRGDIESLDLATARYRASMPISC